MVNSFLPQKGTLAKDKNIAFLGGDGIMNDKYGPLDSKAFFITK